MLAAGRRARRRHPRASSRRGPRDRQRRPRGGPPGDARPRLRLPAEPAHGHATTSTSAVTQPAPHGPRRRRRCSPACGSRDGRPTWRSRSRTPAATTTAAWCSVVLAGVRPRARAAASAPHRASPRRRSGAGPPAPAWWRSPSDGGLAVFAARCAEPARRSPAGPRRRGPRSPEPAPSMYCALPDPSVAAGRGARRRHRRHDGRPRLRPAPGHLGRGRRVRGAAFAKLHAVGDLAFGALPPRRRPRRPGQHRAASPGCCSPSVRAPCSTSAPRAGCRGRCWSRPSRFLAFERAGAQDVVAVTCPKESA